MLKRYERGELAGIEWLDALALAKIRQLRAEARRASPSYEMSRVDTFKASQAPSECDLQEPCWAAFHGCKVAICMAVLLGEMGALQQRGGGQQLSLERNGG